MYKIIIILFAIGMLARWAAKWILRSWMGKLAKASRQQAYNNSQNGQKKADRPIFNTSKKSNPASLGDYVDYEEVK